MPSLVGPRVEVYLSKVLKLLVFDLDGTLADTRHDLAASVNHALVRVGRSALPLETVVGFVGDGVRNLITRSLGASGDGETGGDEVDSTLAAFLEHYRSHCLESTKVYAGVPESLERLSGYRMAVLTNKPEEPARTVLAGLGLSRHFNLILGGDNAFGPKPDPAALRHIMASEAAEPGETAMIGDGLQDLRVSRRAGARFLGFLGGMGSPADLLAGNPDAVFEDMRALPDAVAELEARMTTAGGRP
jgi:2-phosphoglycolate phosphatase